MVKDMSNSEKLSCSNCVSGANLVLTAQRSIRSLVAPGIFSSATVSPSLNELFGESEAFSGCSSHRQTEACSTN